MKYFEPFNRHLWIDKIEEDKEEETGVLLPDSYKPQEEEFAIVKIKDFAPDCNHRWPRDEEAIAEKRMIREIKLKDKIFYVILENYILGIVK